MVAKQRQKKHLLAVSNLEIQQRHKINDKEQAKLSSQYERFPPQTTSFKGLAKSTTKNQTRQVTAAQKYTKPQLVETSCC